MLNIFVVPIIDLCIFFEEMIIQTIAHFGGIDLFLLLSGLPHPSPGDLPNPGIKPESPVSPALQADYLPLESWEKLLIRILQKAIS